MEVNLRINVPVEREFYTAETKKALKALKKEIEPHNKNVDKHKEARQKVENSSPESLSADDLFDGPASIRNRVDLHLKYLDLWGKVAEFSKLHRADHEAGYANASKRSDDKIKEIRDRLTEIGFDANLLHENFRTRVDNLYRMHPEFRELEGIKSDFRSGGTLTGGDRDAVIASLESLKKSQLSA